MKSIRKTLLRAKASLLLGLVALCAFGVTFESQAQFFGGKAGSLSVFPFASTNYTSAGSIITGQWTNVYTSASSSATFPVVDCYNSRNVAVQLSASGTTNTATCAVAIIRSTDGVLFENTPFVVLSASCPSGAATTVNTNFDLGAFEFWTALAWTNTAGVSNAVVKYGIKPGF